MVSKLNPNLNTKYWKVSRVLPPENGKQSVILSIDEKSVETIENQKNKIHYSLTKVYVKIYPAQSNVNQ
ncbi:AAEL010547-PA [Aedes aegypti]|uniref:AAEL010547-PA n=1 Tax=Aedes aegypti TaxID=7159 RepID=Q16SM7_AEDAE|nr:AAEL010547-PA [Aedes aegypti]